MKTAYAILLLNSLVCVGFFFEHTIAGMVLTSIWGLSATGLIGFSITNRKGFAYLAYAGFAPFFPISLLAILNIRRRLESSANEKVQSYFSNQAPLQELYFGRFLLKSYAIAGVCLIVLHVVTFFWMGYVSPAGPMGLALIIIAISLRKVVVIKIYPNGFVYKPGPLASKKEIIFSDVTKIIRKKKKIILKLNNGKSSQKVMMHFLDAPDQMTFCNALPVRSDG